MPRPGGWAGGAAALTLAMFAAVSAQEPAGRPAPRALADAWEVASPGRAIVLPADHASHPPFKLEWWYYTGNLDAADGRRFGYQLTFFRVGVDPAPANPSRWAVRDLFMAHLALTDVAGRRFLFTERLNRPGPGWAGADTGGYHVWNETWDARREGRIHRLTAGGTSSGPPAVPFALDLSLAEADPPVLHGQAGYSRKGADPGNASYYYSLPRMATRGTITIDGRPVAVTGLSWMDHEFGTRFVEPAQVGWDWFAIQLQDGRSLMLYRFRRRDGTLDPYSSGELTAADGRTTAIPFSEVGLEAGRTWSSTTGAHYPIEWTIRLAREKLDLRIAAVLDNQELQTPASTGETYWEGAVDVTGTADGKAVSGRGYLEMTGYSREGMNNYLR